jgi:hypothetical protein
LISARQAGQRWLVGWIANANNCIPGSDKALAAIAKERLVSGWLARERQLLHSLEGRQLWAA